MSNCPRQTPWGSAQHTRQVAPGIWSVETAGHGGYYLDPNRRLQMPEALRDYATYAGPGWYEEDCDWALVVASFPELFDDYHKYAAWDMMRSYHVAVLAEFAESDAGRLFCQNCETYGRTMGDRFRLSSMSTGATCPDGWSVRAVSLDGKRRIAWTQTEHPQLAAPFTLEQVQAVAVCGQVEVAELEAVV